MSDGFELRNDGTVCLQFDENKTVNLRRPTLGEYRLLIEAIERVRSEASAVVNDEADVTTVDKLNDLVLDWFRLVFKTLGDGELPGEDDMPAWVLNSELPRDLIDHWQKVPSRRGVR